MIIKFVVLQNENECCFQDIPIGTLADIYDSMSKLGERIDEIEDVLTNNRLWVIRTKDIGIVKAEDALNLSFS